MTCFNITLFRKQKHFLSRKQIQKFARKSYFENINLHIKVPENYHHRHLKTYFNNKYTEICSHERSYNKIL